MNGIFFLKSKFAIDKPIHKIHFTKYSPSKLATIKNISSIFFTSLPRENAANWLKNSYISLDFEPVASFSKTKLTTFSGKHLWKANNLYAISILRQLLPSNQQTCEFLYGFEESENTQKQELTNIRTEKETFIV